MTESAYDVARRLRLRLCDDLSELTESDFAVKSWCEGWSVLDTLGHLVYLAELTRPRFFREFTASGFRPDAMLEHHAKRLSAEGPKQLIERLREHAGGRFHVPLSPPTVIVGEVVVHANDMLRPLGRRFDVPGSDLLGVLEAYRRVGRIAFRTKRPEMHLVALDADWSYGEGPQRRGTCTDLVLLLANRQQVISELD